MMARTVGHGFARSRKGKILRVAFVILMPSCLVGASFLRIRASSLGSLPFSLVHHAYAKYVWRSNHFHSYKRKSNKRKSKPSWRPAMHNHMTRILTSPELRVHLFKMIKEPFEQLHPQPRILTPNRRSNAMHAQLRQACINRPHSHCRAQHWSYCSA